MKRIKCTLMVMLALGFFALSANAQSTKEVRKQKVAQKMKPLKPFEAKLSSAEKPVATNQTVTPNMKASNKPATKGERKERPNTTKKVEQIKLTATAKKKSGVKKAAKERPAYDFSAKRQEIKAKRATRTSNVKFDREAIQQKIKERISKQ